MSMCMYMSRKSMYSKAALTLIFFVVLTIMFLFLIGTVDLRSYFLRSTLLLVSKTMNKSIIQQPALCATAACHQQSLSPLKVYMYDLPRRFNVGIFPNFRSSNETPVTVKTLPPWQASYGLGNKQHSVEYWMMASLLYVNDGDDEERKYDMEAVRVFDPQKAHVFFVPFFSSLSFNMYTSHKMNNPVTQRDKQLQVDIVKFLRKSKYWQRSGGKDHVIPMHHPNAFRYFREQVNASILIVADFGRYPKSMANLRKDVVAPYGHVVDTYTDDDETSHPFESRTILLFFRGGTVRKAEGEIRASLTNILTGYDDVHYETSYLSEENIRLSTQGMRSSKFCLHPAGDTPSSCRLFDAIVSHCVPVIISNKIELPFEDELDYSQFSIFFSTQEALKPGYIVEQLRQVSKERWVNMWKMLKNISHHYEYQYPPKRGDAVNMLWRQVRQKFAPSSAAMLAAHRTRRLKIPDWWDGRR